MEEFWNAGRAAVGLEAGEEGFDEAAAAGRADTAGQEQCLDGGGRGGLGFLLVEMAGCLIGEKDAAGLVACGGEERT